MSFTVASSLVKKILFPHSSDHNSHCDTFGTSVICANSHCKIEQGWDEDEACVVAVQGLLDE
jgi:hypothetical protein